MAVVYRARDLMLERPVAVKVLRQDFSQDAAFRESFRQEARAAANLSHPNIVTVHDFGLDNRRLYIVMEYVPGTDLKTVIKQRGVFTLEEAIPLMVQACAGIGYAHRAGLVHCDVKPQNMLVTPDQRVKVTDFGIARALASIRPDEKYDVVWGSPQYFAPEQAAGQAPSPASDVYSLGVILYEMLTGELPFNSNDATELARMHREARPVPPRRLNPDIPPELEQILLKVLSKEPSARYRSADQMGRILMTFTNQQEPFPAEIPPAPAPVATQPAPTRVNPAPAPRVVQQQPQPAPQYQQRPPVRHVVETRVETREERPTEVDWVTILLGLLAVVAVGGLVPFWLYIWFALTSGVTP